MQRSAEFYDKHIAMAHGAGGEASRRLLEGLIAPAFAEAGLRTVSDAALLEPMASGLAMSTDSFVVRPLKFPGGSIGELAINGTVNDLAVAGAAPVALTTSFILEAGLDSRIFREEVTAMAAAAARAGIQVVGGDTKVVEHGKADGMYICTTGIGNMHPKARLGPQRVVTGDRIVLSGPIGAHGMTIMIARAELELEADIRSDTRPLAPLILAALDVVGDDIRWMRDATRGGVATVLNELARDAGVFITLNEEAIPVEAPVRGACELLGLDPLHVANEGQYVMVVSAEWTDTALQVLHGHPGGDTSRVIGEISDGPLPRVVARASYGGTRVVDMLTGDPLPRIC